MYTWPDGKNYFGDWVNGQMHGYGVYKWPGGRTYEG